MWICECKQGVSCQNFEKTNPPPVPASSSCVDTEPCTVFDTQLYVRLPSVHKGDLDDLFCLLELYTSGHLVAQKYTNALPVSAHE